MKIKLLFLVVFTLFLVFCDFSTERLSGEVVKVADGDTFTIETATGERIKIRLFGIDAPERGQDFGTKSGQFLKDLCLKKLVTIDDKGKDQYGRTLGVAYLDGLNINEEMVRNGLAWYYNYSEDDPRLERLEREARRQQINIWSMKNPMSPHEYRKGKRKR